MRIQDIPRGMPLLPLCGAREVETYPTHPPLPFRPPYIPTPITRTRIPTTQHHPQQDPNLFAGQRAIKYKAVVGVGAKKFQELLQHGLSLCVVQRKFSNVSSSIIWHCSFDTVTEERADFWDFFTFTSPANTGNPSRKLPLAVTRRCNGFVLQPPPTSAGPPDVTVFVFWFVFVWYEVATVSRLLRITGLFCKRAL